MTAQELELTNTFVEERVAYLIPIFEKLAPHKLSQRKIGVGDIPGWQVLASREARILKTKYPDNKPEDEKDYGTALRQISAIKKELKKAAKTKLNDQALYNSVLTICTHFGSALSFLFSEYKERQNIKYREKVKTRRQKINRIEIDLTNSLEYAYSILLEIEDGKSPNWIDVSCSLALATGRRMAEIHCSATFEFSDEYEVAFKGQLKGKDRKIRIGNKSIPLRNAVFYIPTLLPARLVCLGLEYLDSLGKRLSREDDPETVNRKYSKTLSRAVKSWDIFPEGEGNTERTYHKFRAAYLRASVANNPDIDSYDFQDFAKDILGDDDNFAIDAYKRYEIKENSKTRI